MSTHNKTNEATAKMQNGKPEPSGNDTLIYGTNGVILGLAA
jgi:hypothetical protein